MSDQAVHVPTMTRGSGSRLRALRRHPVLLAILALALAAGAAVAIAAGAGFGPVGEAFARVKPEWLVLVAATQLVGAVGYAVAYRVVSAVADGPKPNLPLTLRLVTAGFGAFTVGGGFLLDYDVRMGAKHDPEEARVRVLGLGALEYAVLAPAACISAIVLIAEGAKAQASLLWPWAIAVPVGFVAAFWAASRRESLTAGGERRRLDEALRGIEVMRGLFSSARACAESVAGIAIYWAAEILSLWAALKTFGAHVSAPALIVAYATGYAATRRTLPLGGAGTTEALLTYALHWVRVSIPTALAGVVAYRAFNFALATLPALHARRAVTPLLRKAAEGEDDLRALVTR